MPNNDEPVPHDHDHDHSDEELEDDFEDEDNIVILQDAEGNEVEYEMMGIVEVEEETFALLTPVAEDDESEELQVVLMRYDEDDDGGMSFSDIDNDDLFQKVQAAAEIFFKELMEESGEDEEE